jgi:UDP-N-acetylmuramyl-tripeptide synthetase
VEFDAATITNIRTDHLDYHGTWENYAHAKYMIIEKLKSGGLAVINKDDEKSFAWIEAQNARSEIQNKNVNFIKYSKTDLENVSSSVAGISFDYQGTHYQIPVIGEYNLENALAVINLALRYLKPQQIAEALKSFQAPKGRMEIVQKEPFTVIIDFAHTPGALRKALSAVAAIKKNNSRLITVFGCAGKRDKSRREMGAVSAELADITVLTAEDPRDERLSQVNDDIIAHATTKQGKLLHRFATNTDYKLHGETNYAAEIDATLFSGGKPLFAFDEDSTASRADAIDFALHIAKSDDIVFITGKAHEQSLAFGKEETEYPWSDHEAVSNALEKI